MPEDVSITGEPEARPRAASGVADERPGRGRRGERAEPTTRPRRPHRSRSQRAVLGMGVGAVVVIALLATAAVYVATKLGAIQHEDVKVDAALDGAPMNILVVGSDSRDAVSKNDPDAGAFLSGNEGNIGQRSDTIMIVRVDPKADHVDMLSLPRDLWLPVAGSTENGRINAAYNEGPQKLVDTIRQDFGIEINHYVEVDFKGFKGIVDAVGGVPMYFDKPMRDTNSGLHIDKVGCQTLNGEEALAFARSRHLQYSDKGTWKDDPTGDLGRITRQQFFIRHLFQHAAAKAVTPDLRVTNDLLNAVVTNVKVDKALDVGRMGEIGRRFASFSPDQIHSFSLPVMPYTTAGGAAVVRMAADDAQPILNDFRGLPADVVPPSAVKVNVQNTSGRAGAAAEAEAGLKGIGFVVTGSADAKPATKRTTVRYPTGYQRMALEVARHLPAGADVVEDKGIYDFTLVLALGSDYQGVTPEARSLTDATAAPTSSAPVTTPAPAAKQGKAAAGSTAKSSSSTASSTTSTTLAVMGGSNPVGEVPGKPPAGVSCG